MQTKHNLNERLLLGYAAGILPEAFNLVVSCHLCLSDESRAMLCSYESLGGCVMNKCTGARMESGSLAATMNKIRLCCDDAKNPDSKAAKSCCATFPKPLQDYVDGGLDSVKWRWLGRGRKQAILPTGKGATARLLFIPAGHSVPLHRHNGLELTLVLQGGFSDETGRFGCGDVEIAGTELQHRPVADAGQDCICLAATDARLKFSHLLPRLLQPVVRI